MKNLKFLSKVALSFQDLDIFDESMEDILADIGSHIDVSRIYIYIDETNEIISNTFRWCAQGTVPHNDHLSELYKNVPSFKEALETEGCFHSNDITNLSQRMNELSAPDEIKSLVAYPLHVDKEIIGFIGIDECRFIREWKDEELEILRTVSRLVSSAYERRKVMNNLKDSESNFRNFFETLDDFFVVSDLEGHIIYGNKAFSDKLGYLSSELIGRNMLTLYPPHQRPDIEQGFTDMLNHKRRYYKLEVKSRTGEKFLVKSRVWVGTWNGETCIYNVSKDITKADENLQLFSTIFERNPLPMMIVDHSDGTLSKVNPEFVLKTGYTKADIDGKTFSELNLISHPDQKAKIKEKYAKDGYITAEELTITCKNNKTLSGLISIEEIISKGKKSLLIVMVDVTERVKLHETLEKNHKKMSHIIEGTRAGTWELDIPTQKTQYDNYWEELLGYSLAELTKISDEQWDALIHPSDLDQAYDKIEKHISGETPYYEAEMRMKHKDGQWIWSQARGKITKVDPDNQPLSMFGIHMDISHRKQMEKELRESEKRFHLALEMTEAGLWDVDLINETIYFSPTWKAILGYTEDEIKSEFSTWTRFIHPDDRKEIKVLGEKYLRGDLQIYESITRFKHKDGSWRWILVRGGVLNDKNGLPVRLIGTNIDITHEHEQSLELERFFTVNLDLLCIKTIEGEFVKANKAWEEVLGYTAKELIGRNIYEFIHPEDVKSTLEIMETLGEKQDVAEFVNRYMRRDGTYRFIEWRLNSYDDTVYAAARDVTNRKQYEDELLEISNRDTLTQIYNRRYTLNRLEEKINDYLQVGTLFTVCLIDIDDFKRINDTYGHQAGDYVLKAFTTILGENLRTRDILGRYGGEEFLIILHGVTAKKSLLIIERILQAVRSKIFIINDNKINVTFSAGVSSVSEITVGSTVQIDEKIAELLNLSDMRMYEAKGAGKDQIVIGDSVESGSFEQEYVKQSRSCCDCEKVIRKIK